MNDHRILLEALEEEGIDIDVLFEAFLDDLREEIEQINELSTALRIRYSNRMADKGGQALKRFMQAHNQASSDLKKYSRIAKDVIDNKSFIEKNPKYDIKSAVKKLDLLASQHKHTIKNTAPKLFKTSSELYDKADKALNRKKE